MSRQYEVKYFQRNLSHTLPSMTGGSVGMLVLRGICTNRPIFAPDAGSPPAPIRVTILPQVSVRTPHRAPSSATAAEIGRPVPGLFTVPSPWSLGPRDQHPRDAMTGDLPKVHLTWLSRHHRNIICLNRSEFNYCHDWRSLF